MSETRPPLAEPPALSAPVSRRLPVAAGQPPWGLRDFVVLDLDGNRLTFAQPFE